MKIKCFIILAIFATVSIQNPLPSSSDNTARVNKQLSEYGVVASAEDENTDLSSVDDLSVRRQRYDNLADRILFDGRGNILLKPITSSDDEDENEKDGNIEAVKSIKERRKRQYFILDLPIAGIETADDDLSKSLTSEDDNVPSVFDADLLNGELNDQRKRSNIEPIGLVEVKKEIEVDNGDDLQLAESHIFLPIFKYKSQITERRRVRNASNKKKTNKAG